MRDAMRRHRAHGLCHVLLTSFEGVNVIFMVVVSTIKVTHICDEIPKFGARQQSFDVRSKGLLVELRSDETEVSDGQDVEQKRSHGIVLEMLVIGGEGGPRHHGAVMALKVALLNVSKSRLLEGARCGV
jgi:hypothetical protein